MPWGDKGGWQGDNHGPWGKPPSSGGGGNPPPGGDPSRGPDFDDYMRQLQQWLKPIMGGGHDGAKGLILLIVVLLGLWLFSGVYFVKADEEGVISRFGAYNRVSSSGLNYHWPYPIESVETPRVTAINHIEIGYHSGSRSHSNEAAINEESLMLTGDENIVDIDFEVQWKISSARDFLFNIRDQETTVKAVAESAMREIIGKSKIATVLAEGKLQVEQDTRKLIQQTLDEYKAGIEIVNLNLLGVNPPTQVLDAFRDVQTARADLETARNQAAAYSNDILPRARGDAQKMILDAQAYKQEVVAHAQGEASRFSAVYNEYKQSKDITRRRMYIESMENIMQGMNKVIIDGKGSQGMVPYMLLPELKPAHAAEEAGK